MTVQKLSNMGPSANIDHNIATNSVEPDVYQFSTQAAPVAVSSTSEQLTSLSTSLPIAASQSTVPALNVKQSSRSALQSNNLSTSRGHDNQPSSRATSASHLLTRDVTPSNRLYNQTTLPVVNTSCLPSAGTNLFNAFVNQSSPPATSVNQTSLPAKRAYEHREVTATQGRFPSAQEGNSSQSSTYSADIFPHAYSDNSPATRHPVRHTSSGYEPSMTLSHARQPSTHRSHFSCSSVQNEPEGSSFMSPTSTNSSLPREHNRSSTADNQEHSTAIAPTISVGRTQTAASVNNTFPAQGTAAHSTFQTSTSPAVGHSSSQPPVLTADAGTFLPTTAATNNASQIPKPSFQELGIIAERPKNPAMAVYLNRLQTFSSWPADRNPTKEELAGAGFYYTGYGDSVRCFCCGGGLRNWDPEDNANVEHVRVLPKCPFMIQKVGQKFINAVRLLARRHKKINFQMVMDNMTEDKSRFSQDVDKEHLLCDPAVQTLCEAGYKEADVLETAVLLREKGYSLSSDTLFTMLDEKGAQRYHESSGASSSTPQNCRHDEEQLKILKQKNKDLRTQTMCKVCMEMSVSFVFLPCGHLVCCSECAWAMRECPVCRKTILGMIRASIG